MSFPVTLPLLFALTLLLSSCGSSTGNNSAATVTWHGPWVQSNQYWPGDAVSFNGRSYINILPTIGQPTSELFEPTDDRFWQLLADQGSDGLNGAVGPVGPSSIIWQGAYVNGKSYVTNDAVEFNSRSFINIQNTTGTQDPTATAYWQLLADKGADGVAGATGPAGIQGIQGLQGNDGADGANGSTGPQGSAGNDGADGATGSAGPQGPAGATGSAGINGISINWQGAWVNGTSYASNDAVSFNGRSYIGTQDTSGIEDPTDTAYWDLLSDKGADGAIGVQGLTGATGSQGVAGNDGADGSTGSTGPQGPAGNDGADGATGSTGPQGSAGNDGADGATGSAGPQGLAGNDGADGATGSAGPQGPAGNDGADGSTGSTGPQGPVGNDGATGSAGPQGSAGNDGADGATGSAGPQGPAGATGSAGINGISINWQGAWVNGTSYASNDAVSFNGRSYIGTQDTSGIEDPTDTAYWDLLSDKGADGAIGVQGLTGATGSQGVAGNDGADGSTGSTGPQGPAGNDGADGATGSNGPQGSAGNDGADGAGPQALLVHDGADGATGSTGPQGSAGNDGADGATGSAGPQGLAGNDGADGATGSAGPQGSLEVRYVIAGFTTTPTLPNIGYLGMSDACQAEFGLSARLATSQQAVDTPNITALSGTAWIQAVRNPSGGNGDFVSGVLPTTWSCAGWTASNTATGLALVGSNFTFAKQLCNTSAPVACAVPAGVEYSYVYTGFSTTQVVGNVGYLGVNSACQSEFGANARMATSLEIINSTGLVAQSGTAWVQAVRHPSGGNSDYTSGVTPNTWSCAGWTANSTATSLTVNGPNISFTKQACNTNSYVACSVPQ